MRTLLTQSLAVLMPFNVQELNDSTGNYYGINQISKNVNIGNRKKLINGNGFVFGVPGSGKSFFCKMEMGSVFLSGDDEIIVIDPMNEYFDIAETYLILKNLFFLIHFALIPAHHPHLPNRKRACFLRSAPEAL